MSNFNWQTEDDVTWDDLAPVQETAVPRRRSWLILIVVGLAVATAGIVIFRQINQRIETTTRNVESDIMASHRLFQQAVRQSDTELLGPILSGRDPDWVAAQKRLAGQGVLFDRSTLGLRWRPSDSPADVELDLDPAFQSAEAAFSQEYVIDAGNGVTETVPLQQTAVYRRGAARWLYAPPDDEFWGEPVIHRGRRLTLVSPQRDEAIAARLVTNLAESLAAVCTSLAGITCPPDWHVSVTLETDASSLLQLSDPEFILGSGLNIHLPAPTLVGLPLDEAGYQALFRGYAVQVVTAVISRLVEYECCAGQPFHLALLDKQLSQLGLRPWPLTPTGYEQLLLDDFQPQGMGRVWNRPELMDEVRQKNVYALIDFLLAETNVSPAYAQRQLTATSGYLEWIRQLFGSRISIPDFKNRWLRFVAQHTRSALVDGPPLPEAELRLMCGMIGSRAGLFRYDLAQNVMIVDDVIDVIDVDTANNISFVPLPTLDGFIIWDWSPALASISQTRLRQNGNEVVVFDAERDSTPPLWFTSAADPMGRFLVMSPTGFVGENDYALLDRMNCRQDNCPLQPLSGMVTWSPAGSRTLVTKPAEAGPPGRLPTTYWGDAQGRPLQEIGHTLRPFWLDEDRLAYFRLDDEGSWELVIADFAQDTTQVVTTAVDLLGTIPEGERPSQINSMLGAAHTENSDQLLLAAYDESDSTYLFWLKQTSGQSGFGDPQLIYQADELIWSLSFAPDGRWVSLHIGPRVDLIELATGTVQTMTSDTLTSRAFRPTWSPDGKWIVQFWQDYLLLIAPDYDYYYPVFHDFAYCSRALWNG